MSGENERVTPKSEKRASRSPRSDTRKSVATGIDVAARYQDIRRLVTAFFKSAATRAYLQAQAAKGRRGERVELDDLVQDVALTVWRRNGQASRYDPARASFSKYVWTVARTVLSHATERQDAEDTAAPEAWARIADADAGSDDGAREAAAELVGAHAPELKSLAKAIEADRQAGQLRLFDVADEAPCLARVA